MSSEPLSNDCSSAILLQNPGCADVSILHVCDFMLLRFYFKFIDVKGVCVLSYRQQSHNVNDINKVYIKRTRPNLNENVMFNQCIFTFGSLLWYLYNDP